MILFFSHLFLYFKCLQCFIFSFFFSFFHFLLFIFQIISADTSYAANVLWDETDSGSWSSLPPKNSKSSSINILRSHSGGSFTGANGINMPVLKRTSSRLFGFNNPRSSFDQTILGVVAEATYNCTYL